MLRKHVHLNYSFKLNQHDLIDSARVGNETRYINHGSDENGTANSTARSGLSQNYFSVHCHSSSDLAVLVHGEPRIALYASKSNLSGESLLKTDWNTTTTQSKISSAARRSCSIMGRNIGYHKCRGVGVLKWNER